MQLPRSNALIVNAENIKHLNKVEKVLPANANSNGSNHILYELEKEVRFRCISCEKRNIRSDEVAFDPKKQTLLCKKCYARCIRPRQFRPLKIHPCEAFIRMLKGRVCVYNNKKLYSSMKHRLSFERIRNLFDPDEIPVQAFFPSGSRSVIESSYDDIESLKFSAGFENENIDDRAQVPVDLSHDVPKDAQALHEYLNI